VIGGVITSDDGNRHNTDDGIIIGGLLGALLGGAALSAGGC